MFRPPATGAELIGCLVVAFFPEAGEEGEWHDGLVVFQLPAQGARWYSVFHESEDFHESWEFPDPETYFGQERAGSHKRVVRPNILPSML